MILRRDPHLRYFRSRIRRSLILCNAYDALSIPECRPTPPASVEVASMITLFPGPPQSLSEDSAYSSNRRLVKTIHVH